MRTVAIIQARMGSSRLPGKVLESLGDRPMLERMIDRLECCPLLDEIVVATSANYQDDPIERLTWDLVVGCHRGSEDDVLGRVLGAAYDYDADLIVELTADCPLIDPAAVGEVIARFNDEGCDYCSNILERSYPRGMDVQVFSTAVLAEVEWIADDPVDREHVSLYIYEHPESYRLRNVAAPPELTDPDLRLTVDTYADLVLVREIFRELHPHDPRFGLADILELLRERPELRAINAHVEQKAVR